MNEMFVEFDPTKDDITALPAKIMAVMSDSFHYDWKLPSFTREIEGSEPANYDELFKEYDITVVRTMCDAHRVEEIRSEIKDLVGEIEHGAKAWEEGEDACSMAECDPSDQFCKSMEIENLEKELKTLIVLFSQ